MTELSIFMEGKVKHKPKKKPIEFHQWFDSAGFWIFEKNKPHEYDEIVLLTKGTSNNTDMMIAWDHNFEEDAVIIRGNWNDGVIKKS